LAPRKILWPARKKGHTPPNQLGSGHNWGPKVERDPFANKAPPGNREMRAQHKWETRAQKIPLKREMGKKIVRDHNALVPTQNQSKLLEKIPGKSPRVNARLPNILGT